MELEVQTGRRDRARINGQSRYLSESRSGDVCLLEGPVPRSQSRTPFADDLQLSLKADIETLERRSKYRGERVAELEQQGNTKLCLKSHKDVGSCRMSTWMLSDSTGL